MMLAMHVSLGRVREPFVVINQFDHLQRSTLNLPCKREVQQSVKEEATKTSVLKTCKANFLFV